MYRRVFFLSVSFLPLFLSSCSKAKSKKWIVADVYVHESLNGAPVSANVQLFLDPDSPNNPSPYDPPQVVYNVITNSEGYARLEYKLPEKTPDYYEYRLYITRTNYIGPYTPFSSATSVKNISLTSENNIDISFTPYYTYSIAAKNVSCTSSTDSVWIEINPYLIEEAYGCADTTFTYTNGTVQKYPTEVSPISLQITTKKSGVVNTYTESHDLLLGKLTPIVVEY